MVVKFCLEAIEDGETPILLGYALGKCVRNPGELRDAELPLVPHPSIAKIAEVYKEFGVVFRPTPFSMKGRG